jgi:hypothetical protein
MKLSNQNIYNLQGCQMPLVGANHFWGIRTSPPPPPPPPPHPPENPCLDMMLYDIWHYLQLLVNRLEKMVVQWYSMG